MGELAPPIAAPAAHHVQIWMLLQVEGSTQHSDRLLHVCQASSQSGVQARPVCTAATRMYRGAPLARRKVSTPELACGSVRCYYLATRAPITSCGASHSGSGMSISVPAQPEDWRQAVSRDRCRDS